MKIKAPKLVTIAILTLITIVFGVGFEVYRTFTTKPAPVVPPAIIEPVDPTLDAATLNKLQQRIYFEANQINEATPTQSPAPAPEVTPTPEASASALPEATP
jgi:hypothetical protein